VGLTHTGRSHTRCICARFTCAWLIHARGTNTGRAHALGTRTTAIRTGRTGTGLIRTGLIRTRRTHTLGNRAARRRKGHSPRPACGSGWLAGLWPARRGARHPGRSLSGDRNRYGRARPGPGRRRSRPADAGARVCEPAQCGPRTQAERAAALGTGREAIQRTAMDGCAQLRSKPDGSPPARLPRELRRTLRRGGLQWPGSWWRCRSPWAGRPRRGRGRQRPAAGWQQAG
jgi:hypothetical protein